MNKSDQWRGTVLLAGPESDCHVVALKLLEFYLVEHGYEVHNLGVCASCREIATACAEVDPRAVLISSQNGHGLKDLADLRNHCRVLGVRQDLPVFVGGNLSVGTDKNPERLRSAFAAVGIVVLQTFEQAEETLRHLFEIPVSMQHIPVQKAV